MGRTKEELKQAACAAIDRNRERIFQIGDAIAAEPEMGYKEFKTAGKFKAFLEQLGIDYRDQVAVTGVVADCPGRKSELRVAVMGELDAVLVPRHPGADPQTGAAHACGHNAMMAALCGVAIALKEADLMADLDGDVVLMAVPAEEFAELEYRNGLREKGIIHFLGGKQEFICRGEFDNIDIAVMQHTSMAANSKRVCGGSSCNGFVGRLIQYLGRESHAGAAPHEGINALNAAMLGLMAVHAQRETFRDQDSIRVHPIITKGGDLVNVVPADVRLETYVRGSNTPAILDAAVKVDRAFRSGGDAVGAQTILTPLPGYLPAVLNEPLMKLVYENGVALYGEDQCELIGAGFGGGSTDQGDVSHLIPSAQAFFAGASGGFHTEDFCLCDKETAYIAAAKVMTMVCIDLLYDGAAVGKQIKADFTPVMTKEEYLRDWGGIEI